MAENKEVPIDDPNFDRLLDEVRHYEAQVAKGYRQLHRYLPHVFRINPHSLSVQQLRMRSN